MNFTKEEYRGRCRSVAEVPRTGEGRRVTVTLLPEPNVWDFCRRSEGQGRCRYFNCRIPNSPLSSRDMDTASQNLHSESFGSARPSLNSDLPSPDPDSGSKRGYPGRGKGNSYRTGRETETFISSDQGTLQELPTVARVTRTRKLTFDLGPVLVLTGLSRALRTKSVSPLTPKKSRSPTLPSLRKTTGTREVAEDGHPPQPVPTGTPTSRDLIVRDVEVRRDTTPGPAYP